MPQDLTGAVRDTSGAGSIDTILKEFYLGPVREQLNSETLLMRRLSRNEENVEGREVVIPLHTGRTPGIIAALEGADMPDPGSQGYTDMRFQIPFNYGRIRISGPAMASARTKRGAFIRILDQEIRGLVRDFKNDLNRQLWGDGSGRLATIDGIASDPIFNVRGVWDFGDQAPSFRHLQVGDRVGFEDFSGASVIRSFAGAAGWEAITAVDFNNRTFEVPGAGAAPAVGDHVIKGPNTTTAQSGASPSTAADYAETSFRGCVNGSPGTPRTKKEMMGLVGICSGNGTTTTQWPINSTGTYAAVAAGQTYCGTTGGTAGAVGQDLQGVASATASDWVSNNFFNVGVGRALSTDLMQQAFDACEEIGQATPSIGITTYGVRRKYVDLLVSDRRYVNEYTLDGGFKAVDFNGVPIVPEKDCPEGSMFFLSEDYLSLYRMSDFYWLDKDGAILSRVTGKDSWEAIMAYYSELATDRRNTHAVIGDIAI